MITSKCLRGDEEAATSTYVNPAKIKDKEKEKFIQEARQYALRMGGYRQSFGYIALQLFDENQQMKPNPDNAFPGIIKFKSDKDVRFFFFWWSQVPQVFPRFDFLSWGR
jgi:hypothetical protein